MASGSGLGLAIAREIARADGRRGASRLRGAADHVHARSSGRAGASRRAPHAGRRFHVKTLRRSPRASRRARSGLRLRSRRARVLERAESRRPRAARFAWSTSERSPRRDAARSLEVRVRMSRETADGSPPPEGRRARDRAAGRHHGGEAHRRAHPALPPAAADARRGPARVVDGAVEIEASAETTAQTGVEMEALTAVSVAALTVYDMAKAIDKGMRSRTSASSRRRRSPRESGGADGFGRGERGRSRGYER